MRGTTQQKHVDSLFDLCLCCLYYLFVFVFVFVCSKARKRKRASEALVCNVKRTTFEGNSHEVGGIFVVVMLFLMGSIPSVPHAGLSLPPLLSSSLSLLSLSLMLLLLYWVGCVYPHL